MLQRNVRLQFLVVLILAMSSCAEGTLSPPVSAKKSVLSRKKRFVAFPEGSSVSAAICMTIGVLGNPNTDFLSWAENWGVAYDLPNYTWVKQHAHGFANDLKNTKAAVLRRSRRDLYEKIEMVIDNMGFNGQACIARALCESSKTWSGLKQRRGNMIDELVRTIFSLPREAVHSHESAAMHEYDRIYRRAQRDTLDCGVEYGECHFSLLELALGRYSVPPTKHGPSAKAFKSLSFM